MCWYAVPMVTRLASLKKRKQIKMKVNVRTRFVSLSVLKDVWKNVQNELVFKKWDFNVECEKMWKGTEIYRKLISRI